MINSYLNVTVIAEWITFIASVLLLDKRTTRWRLFIVLLFLVLCTETTGWYFINRLHIYNNALPFNILMLGSNIFFMWFFSKEALIQRTKKLLAFLGILFLIFGLLNLFFFQGFWIYNSISEAAGDIILSILCCYFLYTLVKDPAPVNLLNMDIFWLATGILFYSLGSAMLYQFSYLLADYYKKTNINIGNYINYALNLVMYTTMIIAFICRRKATR